MTQTIFIPRFNYIYIVMHMRMLFILLLLTGTFTFAAGPAGKPLSHAQQGELDSLCTMFKVALCDSGSIAGLCGGKKNCIVACRLAEFARWLVVEGRSYDDCLKDLSRRYDCLTAPPGQPVDITRLPVVGDKMAPVVIVVYIFDMCPVCTYLYTRLHREVTSGGLKGKVKLAAKLFDTKADSTVKSRFSKFWDYIAALTIPVPRQDDHSPIVVADSGNPFSPAYKKLVTDLKFRIKPVTFREKGSSDASVNPPILINGKRYRGYNNPRWIVDAALYEFETKRN
jgi:hypothetical protein